MRFSRGPGSRFFFIWAILSRPGTRDCEVTETGANFPEPVVSGTTNNYSIWLGRRRHALNFWAARPSPQVL